MYNAAAKAAFLYPKLNPKGCIHAVQMDSDTNFFIKNCLFTISIHAAHEGSDRIATAKLITAVIFQSTLPVWAATELQNTLVDEQSISIHAARVGSDHPYQNCQKLHLISIHAAHAGSDRLSCAFAETVHRFQSTLPMRAATKPVLRRAHRKDNFNPRCPCGQRQSNKVFVADSMQISIHAAHAGSDLTAPMLPAAKPEFQSTLPMRAATGYAVYRNPTA